MNEDIDAEMFARVKARRKWKEIGAWSLWSLDDATTREFS